MKKLTIYLIGIIIILCFSLAYMYKQSIDNYNNYQAEISLTDSLTNESQVIKENLKQVLTKVDLDLLEENDIPIKKINWITKTKYEVRDTFEYIIYHRDTLIASNNINRFKTENDCYNISFDYNDGDPYLALELKSIETYTVIYKKRRPLIRFKPFMIQLTKRKYFNSKVFDDKNCFDIKNTETFLNKKLD